MEVAQQRLPVLLDATADWAHPYVVQSLFASVRKFEEALQGHVGDPCQEGF
jgi:hypothetical protein